MDVGKMPCSCEDGHDGADENSRDARTDLFIVSTFITRVFVASLNTVTEHAYPCLQLVIGARPQMTSKQ